MTSTLQIFIKEVQNFAAGEGIELSPQDIKDIANRTIGFMTNEVLDYRSNEDDDDDFEDSVSPLFRKFQLMTGEKTY